MSRFIMPRQGVKGQNLSPEDGAKLHFKVIGQGIGGTNKAVFTNEALTIADTNPVIADAKGLFGELWQNGDYDVFLTDKNDIQLWGPETIRDLVQSIGDKLTPLTVAAMVNDVRFSVDDVGKSAPITKENSIGNGGGATYDIISGTGTANGFNIIAHDSESLSFVLRVENSEVSARSIGIVANSVPAAANNVLGFAALATLCNDNTFYGLIDCDSDTFHIDSDIFLPKYYRATGDNGASTPNSIDGADVIYQHGSYGKGSGNLFVSHDFIVNGGQNHQLANVRARGFLRYVGFSDQIGLFWCLFEDMRGAMFFDLSVFAVNANTFLNCNPFGDDTKFAIEISDNGGVLERECHMNQFIGCDMSRTKGAINNSSKNQMNFIQGGYGEGMTGNFIADGSNFSLMNNNLDATGTYTVGLHNNIMNTVDISSRTGGDFMPLLVQNHAAGGVWDLLDSAGKPVCFSGTGLVEVDIDAPFGSFRMYGETTTVDFRGVTVTIPPILNGGKFNAKFSMTAIWRGDIPAAITIDAQSYSPGQCCTTLGGGFFLIRLTGIGSVSSDTSVTVFRTTTGGTSREGFMGNVWVSEGKIAPLPKTPALSEDHSNSYISGGLLKQQSMVALGYSATSPKTISVVFPIPYKAGEIPIVTPSLEALDVASSTRTVGIQAYLVTNLGFDAVVTHNSDYTGRLHWRSEGVLSKV